MILDFSSVNNIDATSVQGLIDVRNQLERYAAPEPVDWHFANIESRWTKRGLAAAGFGFRTPRVSDNNAKPGSWKTIFSIADLGGTDSPAKLAELESRRKSQQVTTDIENVSGSGQDEDIEELKNMNRSEPPKNPGSHKLVVIQGLNRPYFHFDLQEAVEAALENAERR